MAKHAKLSPSGAERWMTCPASVRMEEGIKDEGSSFANEGTVAHEIAERCLIADCDASEYKGLTVVNLGFEPVEVDDEMVDNVQMYIDYVRAIGGDLHVEQRLDLRKWIPGGFGTSDTVVLKDRCLYVVDLKYGKGVKVYAKDNKQAGIYGLGAIAEFDFLYDFDTIKLVIHQPRLDHVDEHTITVEELLEFGEEVKEKAKIAASGKGGFNPTEKGCMWCMAKGDCKALAEYALEALSDDFDGIGDELNTRDVEGLPLSDLAMILPKVDLIKGWVKALEARSLTELENGKTIENFKLVRGRSIRKWDDNDVVEELLKKRRIRQDVMYTRKLISPTQAEKLLGKDDKILKSHVIKPEGKLAIASSSDKRPEVKLTFDSEFEGI